MEMYLFQPTEWERWYNCSSYDVNQIPLERRQHKLLGIAFLIMTTICQVLYVPCMISIWGQIKGRLSSCYKIMFYIGVVDMLTLCVNGWLTGWFGLKGDVYCSYPNLIYITGAFALGCWCCETTVEVVLAFDRCVELYSSDLGGKMFGSKMLWVWLGIPAAWGFYIFYWTKPILFSGIYFAWFYNPHLDYIDDTEHYYENIPHTTHNNVLVCTIIATYVSFLVILVVKYHKKTQEASDQSSFSSKMIFLQVALISAVNAIAASVYVAMNYIRINETIIIIGHICWLNAHGIPPIIYLTMNKSIQRDCKAMLFKILKKKLNLSMIRGSTTVHPHNKNTSRVISITRAAKSQTTAMTQDDRAAMAQAMAQPMQHNQVQAYH